MSRTITVESLTLLIAIDTLGPDVPTSTAAEWCQKAGVRLPTQGGTKRASLQGSIRQSLRAHLKNGRVKFRKVPGVAYAGELYLWTVTPEGREEISRHVKTLRRVTSMSSLMYG